MLSCAAEKTCLETPSSALGFHSLTKIPYWTACYNSYLGQFERKHPFSGVDKPEVVFTLYIKQDLKIDTDTPGRVKPLRQIFLEKPAATQTQEYHKAILVEKFSLLVDQIFGTGH